MAQVCGHFVVRMRMHPLNRPVLSITTTCEVLPMSSKQPAESDHKHNYPCTFEKLCSACAPFLCPDLKDTPSTPNCHNCRPPLRSCGAHVPAVRPCTS